MLIILSYSNYSIKMSQYRSFPYAFSILFVTYLSFNFLSKYFTTSSEEIFFMDNEKLFTFFMVNKGIKSNHNNFFVVYLSTLFLVTFLSIFVHLKVLN